MNIKLVWAFAVVSLCIFLVAADDDDSDNSNDSVRIFKRRFSKKSRVQQTAPGNTPEVDEQRIVNRRPLKRRYPKKKKPVFISTQGGGSDVQTTSPEDDKTENNNRLVVNVKKRVVKRRRTKRVNTEETSYPNQADGEIVVTKKRPVIKRKKIKTTLPREPLDEEEVSVNRRPVFKKKKIKTTLPREPVDEEEVSLNVRPVIKKKKIKTKLPREPFDEEEVSLNVRPSIYKKKKIVQTGINVNDGYDDSAWTDSQSVYTGGRKEIKPAVLKKKNLKITVHNNGEDFDDQDYYYNRPPPVQKGKIYTNNVNQAGIQTNDEDVNDEVSLSTQGGGVKRKRVSLFGSVPKPTVNVAVGGMPARILEGPIRKAEIVDKAIKAIVSIVKDTKAKNIKIVEQRIANLFNLRVDNIGGALNDVICIKKNNNKAVKDVIAVLSSSVDNSVDTTVNGVGGVINGVGLGKSGESVFKNTVDCVIATLKNILWTKLNVLEYIYKIKTQFLTLGLFEPISVLPKLESRIGVCLSIY